MNRIAALHAIVLSAAMAALFVAPDTARAANFTLDAGEDGELAITAHNAQVIEALEALGEEVGFEVLATRGPKRTPVTLQMQDAPVEDVLRELLRGRNYAVVYEDDEISQVILLEPSKPGSSRPVRARPARPAARGKARGGKAANAPVVIRN